MTIISSGKLNADDGSVVFTCPNCGCKFKAAPDEYYRDTTSWLDSPDNVVYTTYTLTSKHYENFHANCPECHKMCCERIESKRDYWYSITCNGNTISSDHVDISCSEKTECGGTSNG